MKREKFSSRLGFLLISAGCAIGIGNVWRFPYITGQYGGAAFVLMYLFFLIIIGLPIMVMEFSVGRASQQSIARSFYTLEPKGSKWHLHGYVGMAANYLLMMFYTTIGGWMLDYFFKMILGKFEHSSPKQVRMIFNQMTENPGEMTFWMVVIVLLGFGICSMGLQNGVEKITKVMMSSLFIIMIALAVRSVTLPGAYEGLKFYLYPDFARTTKNGLFNAVFAAMGQAFFTLSLGIGSIAIFGSYINKDHTLTGEAVSVTILDTAVALLSGFIIFPACFSFGVTADSGPNLIFITLPNVFNSMPLGRLWGGLFFLFLAFAALSTIVAVFQNILSCCTDLWHWSLKKAVLINLCIIIIGSMPCLLGFNILRSIQPLGIGSTILDLEDFIISYNLLPLGSLVYLLFCVLRYGWGWNNFLKEANTGKGIRFPKWPRIYLTFILPVLILFIMIQGYISKFS